MNQFWDSNELDLLKRCYSTYMKDELLKLFPNRTYQAIQRMASYLDIERPRIDFHHTPEARIRMSKSHTGVKLSSIHKAHMRRCSINESAFDTLTETALYWIGYMIADGNISYKKGIPIVALHIKAEDFLHLLKFREFIGSSHKVGTYVNKTCGNTSHSLSFSSEKIANTLEKYGIVPNKCFIAVIKGGVEYNRHLWRGVTDGDGTLGVYVRKNLNGTVRGVPYIALTGTKDVCSQFKSFLKQELGEPMPPNVIPYKKSYLYMIEGHRAIKSINLLYSDCRVALERKLTKASEIMEDFQRVYFTVGV